MAAADQYALEKFSVIMTKVANKWYNHLIQTHRGLPWKNIAQRPIEKVFERIIGTTEMSGTPAERLNIWLKEKYPKINWAWTKEGRLKVEWYEAAYAVLYLDWINSSPDGNNVRDKLSDQDRKIIDVVYQNRVVATSELTLELLEAKIIESVNSAAEATPENSFSEVKVGPTPKTMAIDKLRKENRALQVNLNDVRYDRTDIETDLVGLRKEFDRQQAAYSKEISELKKRLAKSENQRNEDHLALEERNKKIAALEAKLTDVSKSKDEVILSQRRTIADNEAESESKNQKIVTLEKALADCRKALEERPPVDSDSSNQKTDAQTSYNDNVASESLEMSVEQESTLTEQAEPQNLAYEMLMHENEALKQEIVELKTDKMMLKFETLRKDGLVNEKEQRRRSVLDHMKTLENEIRRKSLDAKNEHQRIREAYDKQIGEYEEIINTLRYSRRVYIDKWRDERAFSDELYKRAQLAAIIENPDISQTDDNITATEADAFQFETPFDATEIHEETSSHNDTNASPNDNIEENQGSDDSVDETAVDLTVEDGDEEYADANDSFLPGEIPRNAFVVPVKMQGGALIDSDGHRFYKVGEPLNGDRWVCCKQGVKTIRCKVRLYTDRIRGKLVAYSSERLNHNHAAPDTVSTQADLL